MWYIRDLLICVQYWITLCTFAVLLTLIFRALRDKEWTPSEQGWDLEHLAGIKYSFIPPTEHLLCARHSTEYGLLFLCPSHNFFPSWGKISSFAQQYLLSSGFDSKGLSWAHQFQNHFLNSPQPLGFQGEPWQIITKEEHEVGLLWVRKPHKYLPLF